MRATRLRYAPRRRILHHPNHPVHACAALLRQCVAERREVASAALASTPREVSARDIPEPRAERPLEARKITDPVDVDDRLLRSLEEQEGHTHLAGTRQQAGEGVQASL